MKLFSISLALLLLCSFSSACSEKNTEPEETAPPAVPEQPSAPEEDTPSVPDIDDSGRLTPDMVYKTLGLGWNLGNQLDAHANGVSSETAWGNPVVGQPLFDAVKRAGFQTVRVPVTWMGHFGQAPEYKIDSAWLDRVEQIVGYAQKAGLNVIINIHHDGADSAYWLDIKQAAKDPAFNAEVEAKINAIWSQVAERFADRGEFLIFEGLNEIHDGGWGWGENRTDGGKQYAVLNGWHRVFVDAVRAAGGENETRWLGIPTYCTQIDKGSVLILPDDPANRLMVSVHCYEPYEYTLNATYSEWGHTGKAGLKDQSDEKTLVGEFDKIVSQWVSKGIPVYIGEFGNVRRDTARGEAFRRYYLQYYAKAASDRKLPIIFWDNGNPGTGKETSGLFNRVDGSWFNDAEVMVKAMTDGYYNPDLTLEGIYATAPR